MFGYRTNDDYYHDASPVHRLKSVQVPMLCLNAADDVFSPFHGELFYMQYCTLFKIYCGVNASNTRNHISYGLIPLQLFQWRQWSRIPTWHSSSPVTEAILVSLRVCGPDRAPTWTESSGSLPKRSLNKAADSKTSHDKRLLQRILLVSLPYFLSYSSLLSPLSGYNISFYCCHLSFHSSLPLTTSFIHVLHPSFYSVHPLFPTTWF